MKRILQLCVVLLFLAATPFFLNNGPADIPGCHFAPGQLYAWKLKMTSRSLVNPAAVLAGGNSAPTGGSRTSRLRLDASLYMRLQEASAQDGLFTLETVLTGAKAGRDFNPEILPDLQTPFLIRMDARCAINSFAFTPAHRPPARDVLRLLFQTMEFVAPEAPAARWQLLQEDGTGVWQAAYHLSDDTPPVVHRRRLGFESVRVPVKDVMLTAEVVRSKATAVPAADRAWYRSMTVDERIRIRAGTGRLFTDVSSRIRLKTHPAPATTFPARPATTPLSWESGRGFDPRYRRVSRYDGLRPDPALLQVSYDEMMKIVGPLLASGTMEDRNKGLDELISLLRLRPESARDLLRDIRAGRYSDNVESWLFFALEKAGTPVAEEVLVEAMEDGEMREMNRIRATHALADTRSLSPEGLDAISRLAERFAESSEEAEVESAGVLALGVVGKNHPNQPEYRQLVRDQLSRLLGQSTSEQELTTILAGIGNARNPALAQDILPFLTNESPLVRGNAATALMDSGSPGALSQITKMLRKEKEPHTRAAITAAVVSRGLTGKEGKPIDDLISSLQTEKDPGIRYNIVRALGSAAPKHAGAKDALIQHFKREQNPRIQVEIGRHISARDLVRGTL